MNVTQEKRVGRPATGSTKSKPGLTLNAELVARAKKEAFRLNMSFSAYVEKAIFNHIGKLS